MAFSDARRDGFARDRRRRTFGRFGVGAKGRARRDGDDDGDDDDDERATTRRRVDASSRPRASAGDDDATTTTTTGRAATRQLGRGLNSSGTRETRGGVGPRRATGERVRTGEDRARTRGGMARVTYFCSRGDGRERRGDRARGRRAAPAENANGVALGAPTVGGLEKGFASTMTVVRR